MCYSKGAINQADGVVVYVQEVILATVVIVNTGKMT